MVLRLDLAPRAYKCTSLVPLSDDRNCFCYPSAKMELWTSEETKGTKVWAVGGYQVSNLGGWLFLLSSSSKNINYQLHQYEVTGSGSAGQLYSGQEIGYTLPWVKTTP